MVFRAGAAPAADHVRGRHVFGCGDPFQLGRSLMSGRQKARRIAPPGQLQRQTRKHQIRIYQQVQRGLGRGRQTFLGATRLRVATRS